MAQNTDCKEVRIWGIKFNLLTVSEIVCIVNKWIMTGRKGIHLTGVNAYTVAMSQNDNMLRNAILDSDIVNVDSYLPTKYLRKKGFEIQDRVPTPEVFEALLKNADQNKQSVYLLGATDKTLEKLVNVLKYEYPHIVLQGYHNGYFDDSEESMIVENIAALAPDYLYIAMPSPKKEHFIMSYKHLLNVGCLYGVGGAFEAKVGDLRRPPEALSKYGMEGLLRVLRKPGVYAKRLPKIIAFIRLARK